MIVQLPNIDTLNVLNEIQKQYNGKLCRLDIAFDFTEYDKKWFEQHRLLKWRQGGLMHDHEGTLYFNEQSGRKKE